MADAYTPIRDRAPSSFYRKFWVIADGGCYSLVVLQKFLVYWLSFHTTSY